MALKLIEQATDWTRHIGVEDFADRLSFLITCGILAGSSLVIAARQYVMDAISCYTPVSATGEDFDDYLESYCWIHGTIPISPNETFPMNPKTWAQHDQTRKLNYYQWVPFVLGVMAILVYLPRMLWQFITNFRTGVDIETIIQDGHDASNKSGSDRSNAVKDISEKLEDMLFQRRYIERNGSETFVKRAKSLLCGHRTGNVLLISYIFIKMIYAVMAVLQIFLIAKFLGFYQRHKGDHKAVLFGFQMLSDMIYQKTWAENMIFPRITYCYLKGIRHVSGPNQYMAQCILPVNMINEKLFMFLYFWFLFVMVISLLSVPVWLVRMNSFARQKQFIRKYLRINATFDKASVRHKKWLTSFINGFLRSDGIFIIRMLSINSGDVVTGEVVDGLWKLYLEKYCDQKGHFSRSLSRGVTFGKRKGKNRHHKLSSDSGSPIPV